MTREEAIHKLVNARYADEFQGDEELTKAHLMAIKALEQEPCEDCISRDAVIKHICEYKECYKDECKGRLYKRCWDIQWVYDLPPVTPQRNTRYWIGQKKIGFGKYKEYIVPLKDGFVTGSCHYCPYCGAEMAESEGKR